MRCQRTGKVRYPEKSAADVALFEVRVAVALGRGNRRESRSYRCEFCGAWHLTSQPQRKRRARS